MTTPSFVEREQINRDGLGVVWRGRRPSEITRRIEGLDLARCLRASGPFPIQRAVDVVRQLLAALEVVHGDRAIHADVQPCNVVVEQCADGEVVSLVDFGGKNDARGAMATEYLAPEVIAGTPPSVSSDLYAVGVILYELVTGAPPFVGRTAIEVMTHQLHDAPPPPSRRRADAAVLDGVCARAMARHPVHRFPDARTFANALCDAMIDEAWT